MLGILLTILKILLWIILGILGLIILILLLVLFSPIRYRVNLDYHETAHVEAQVKYLIVKVKVLFDQKTKQMDQVIRVCGFRLGGKKKKKDTEDFSFEASDESLESFEKLEMKQETSGDTETIEAAEQADFSTETISEEPKPVEVDIAESEAEDMDEQEESSTIDPLYDLFDEETLEPLPEGEKKFFGRVIALLRKIIDTLSKFTPGKIIDKLQTKKAKLDKKVNRLKKFWNLSCTVKTRAYLKKYIKSFFKHILPRKAKGYVHYGFDEPYKTGQITGYLSLLPFVYQKKVSFQPDFYNKVIDVKLDMKGKIRLGYLARIVLNINIWRTLKALRKVMK